MFSIGKQLVALASMPLATAGLALPAPAAVPASTVVAASAAIDLPAAAPAPAPAPIEANSDDSPVPAVAAAAPLSVSGDPAARIVLLIAAAAADWSAEPATVAPAEGDRGAAAAAAKVDAELECMAKVVVHEAGNQSRRGQLAVAQLIMNRIESGRFPATPCGVANQRGQFFHTASYNPPRDSATWASAVEVSRQARERNGEDVAPGALFFHAAYAAADGFFRTRQRVATLGDHIFYR